MITALKAIGVAFILLSLLVIAGATKISGNISREEELKEWQRKRKGSEHEEAQEMD